MVNQRSSALEPLNRLEDKVKRLIGLVERLQQEKASALGESERLNSELDALRTRLAESDNADSEVAVLRAERDQIRTRVTGMLEQLEAIDL
jgi:regulator of replication initiation timing